MPMLKPGATLQDRYGFRFWLGWILWFAGSLVLSAAAWTAGMQMLWGSIRGPELTLTWALAVFGSWFLLVIPFMRKKEQIWKRLNDDQEKALDAWLKAMGLFIGLLILSALFWSYYHRVLLTAPDHRAVSGLWLKQVAATWMVLFLPFLVWMYKKADNLFQVASARQTIKASFQSTMVERSKRLLSEEIQKKIKNVPPTLPRGHVLTLQLRNGERVPHVFVIDGREILGLYDRETIHFEAGDVEDIAVEKDIPVFEESKWLRLDGRR